MIIDEIKMEANKFTKNNLKLFKNLYYKCGRKHVC